MTPPLTPLRAPTTLKRPRPQPSPTSSPTPNRHYAPYAIPWKRREISEHLEGMNITDNEDEEQIHSIHDNTLPNSATLEGVDEHSTNIHIKATSPRKNSYRHPNDYIAMRHRNMDSSNDKKLEIQQWWMGGMAKASDKDHKVMTATPQWTTSMPISIDSNSQLRSNLGFSTDHPMSNRAEASASPVATPSAQYLPFPSRFEHSLGSSPSSDHTASSLIQFQDPNSASRTLYISKDRYRSPHYHLHRESSLQSDRDSDYTQSDFQPPRQTKLQASRKYRQSVSGDGTNAGGVHHVQPRAIHPGKIRGFLMEANKTAGVETKHGVKLVETEQTMDEHLRRRRFSLHSPMQSSKLNPKWSYSRSPEPRSNEMQIDKASDNTYNS